MSRSKLYIFVLSISIAGIFWLFWNSQRNLLTDNTISVCLFKTVIGVPCPSCGTTRSLLLISKGNFIKALMLNPLGYLGAAMLVIFPFWIVLDFIRKSDSFFRFYRKSEKIIQRKPIAVFLIILILSNWIWNIYKDL